MLHQRCPRRRNAASEVSQEAYAEGGVPGGICGRHLSSPPNEAMTPLFSSSRGFNEAESSSDHSRTSGGAHKLQETTWPVSHPIFSF